MHSFHPLPWVIGGGGGGGGGCGFWTIFQNIYLGGTKVNLGFLVGIINLGRGGFFQLGLENSLYEK